MMKAMMMSCTFLTVMVLLAGVLAAPHHCNSSKDKSKCRNELKKKLNISDAELVDLHLTNPDKVLDLNKESHEESHESHEESHEHSHENDDEQEGTFPIEVPDAPEKTRSHDKAAEESQKNKPALPTGFSALPPIAVQPVQVREQFFRGPYVNGKGEAIPFLKRVIEFYYYPVDGSLPVAGEIELPKVVQSEADPDLRAFQRIASGSSGRAQRDAEMAAIATRRRAGLFF